MCGLQVKSCVAIGCNVRKDKGSAPSFHALILFTSRMVQNFAIPIFMLQSIVFEHHSQFAKKEHKSKEHKTMFTDSDNAS
jgi:hypothetical protein